MRGDAGLSLPANTKMGNPISTASKRSLDGVLPTKNSTLMMQDTGTTTWPSMSSNRAEIYSSPKLAPVDPADRPIFTIDPLAFKSDQKSRAISFVVHAVAITLLLTIAFKYHSAVTLEPTVVITPVEFKLTMPPVITPPVAKVEGGGGSKSIVQPKAAPVQTPVARAPQINTKSVIRLDNPKLALAPVEQVKMPDNMDAVPAFSAAQGPQVALATQPKATGSGFGTMGGGGLGGGHGTGSGGGYGGGLMSVGGGVSAPQVIHTVEPEFTEEARSANFGGNVQIKLIVDSQGNPQDIRLVNHLGMGLDEKAIAAVHQYKFRPAMFQGHPVSVQIILDVSFRLH